MDKKIGKILYDGGEDVVFNKRSKAVTKIIDHGKDYVINVWLKKPEGGTSRVIKHCVQMESIGTREMGKAINRPDSAKEFIQGAWGR